MLLVIVCVVCLSVGSIANGQSFQGLGDLAGGDISSSAEAISADGSIVVGESNTANGREAFRWTSSGGMVGLGDLPGGVIRSYAYGISADGSTIVGRGRSANGFEACQWSSGGVSGLGDLPGGRFSSSAGDASANGSVIVGGGNTTSVGGGNGEEAFRWTSSGGMVGLGYIPGDPYGSISKAVSDDGGTVVGYSTVVLSDGTYRTEAFRWTSGGGMVGLGDGSQAWGISGDGLVITGVFGGGMLRWTSQTGMVGLGGFDGGPAAGRALSHNGDVIVGTGTPKGGSATAIIWDEANGMRSILDVLVDAGVDMTGWNLRFAHGISADGTMIVGSSTNPDGNQEAWLATIISAPETVTPDSVTPTRGDYVSGGVPELEASDNMDYSMRRRQADTQSRTEFEVTGISTTSNPANFQFTLEGAVFARSNVVQTIEFFDYVAQAWEVIDSTNAVRSPAPDSVVTATATGDLSRFVEAGTLSVKARVRYKSDSPRQRFASNTDQTVWTIE